MLFTSEIVEENLIILDRHIEVENEIRRIKTSGNKLWCLFHMP